MSRRPPLRPGATRRAYPKRSTKPIAKSTKPIKKVNPERLAKRRKSYAQKLAAYRRSETYALVQERAGGRCEQTEYAPECVYGSVFGRRIRCTTNVGVHHHHLTYARFGGRELPTDIQVLCEYHHALAEAAFPNRRHGR